MATRIEVRSGQAAEAEGRKITVIEAAGIDNTADFLAERFRRLTTKT